jgi:hypothetical protein
MVEPLCLPKHRLVETEMLFYICREGKKIEENEYLLPVTKMSQGLAKIINESIYKVNFIQLLRKSRS